MHGGQLYCAFPFSKESLLNHSDDCCWAKCRGTMHVDIFLLTYNTTQQN